MPSQQLEIVGLEKDTNGRSCNVHDVCGEHVKAGDVLRLVQTVVTYDGRSEMAVKCVKMVDGVDTCTVAFVPRAMCQLPHVQAHLKKFVQVVELYSGHKNSYKRSKSHQNFGMASVELLTEDDGCTE